MPDAVGIAVHHEEGVLSARDDEMRGVVAGPRRVRHEIRVRRFLLEIFHAPRAPERFDLGFRELHQVLQLGRETTNRLRKVEQAFTPQAFTFRKGAPEEDNVSCIAPPASRSGFGAAWPPSN